MSEKLLKKDTVTAFLGSSEISFKKLLGSFFTLLLRLYQKRNPVQNDS